MIKMKSIKHIFRTVAIAVFVLLMNGNLYAADFNAAASSTSAVQGETVTVTVTFSSSASIGAYAMRMSYDAGILEYSSGADGGGGGTLQFYNDYVNSTSKSYSITFNAIGSGTSNLTFETISTPCDIDANDMTVKASNGSVTVSAPVSYSSDNNLAALNVSGVNEDGSTVSVPLSPEFSTDVTSYNASIGADVARLSLDASAADGKAAVNVSGTRMDPGSNTTTITVTAENGSVKTYKIYTEKERSEEVTTEQETPPQETTVPEETTAEETPSADTPEALNVTVNGQQYIVTDVSEENMAVPEGYEIVQLDYKGNTVLGLQGLSSNVTLLYLVNGQTQEGSLFVYNKTTDRFVLYVPLTVRQQIYTILTIPEDVALPFNGKLGEEYSLKNIKIDGKDVEALDYGAEGIYLVYAISYSGNKSFYFYDTKEGTMVRYQYSELEESLLNSNVQSANASVTGNERKAFESRIEKRNLLIYILIGLIVILIQVILIVSIVIKHGKDDNEEDDEYMEEEIEEDEEEPEDIEEEDEEPLDEEKIDEALENLLNKK